MPGLLKITFNSGVTDGTMSDHLRHSGRCRRETPVKPNAKQTNVGGDFPHMFDISEGGARVLVFTDKEQDTPGVMVVTAVTYVNAAVTMAMKSFKSLGESRDDGASFPGTFDDDTDGRYSRD